MKIQLIILGILIFAGCNVSEPIFSKKKEKFPFPPGCVKISDNLYADKIEISNSYYREYLWWLKSKMGSTSQEYLNAIPDTTVWNELDGLEVLTHTYLRGWDYPDYPVVGLSLEQAKGYCTWRSERVAEMQLIKNGVISPNRYQDRENYFTLEKFLNGEYIYVLGDSIYADEPIVIEYGEYRIPTAEEWELIAGINTDDLMSSIEMNKHNKRVLKNKKHLFNTSEYQNNLPFPDTTKTGTLPHKGPEHCYTFSKNRYGMYSVVGNVSEMIAEEGKSKGSNWRSSSDEFNKDQTNTYTKPNCWTGFRSVCYPKKIKIRMGVQEKWRSLNEKSLPTKSNQLNYVELLDSVYMEFLSDCMTGYVNLDSIANVDAECFRRLKLNYTDHEINVIKSWTPKNFKSKSMDPEQRYNGIIEFIHKKYLPETKEIRQIVRNQLSEIDLKMLNEFRHNYLLDLKKEFAKNKAKIQSDNGLSDRDKLTSIDESNITEKFYQFSINYSILKKNGLYNEVEQLSRELSSLLKNHVEKMKLLSKEKHILIFERRTHLPILRQVDHNENQFLQSYFTEILFYCSFIND